MIKADVELFYVAKEEMHAVNVLVDMPVTAILALIGEPAFDGAEPAFSPYDRVRAGRSCNPRRLV